MTRLIGSVVIVFAVGVTAAETSSVQAVTQAGLDTRIGPANHQRYGAVVDAQNWKNPRLVIRRDGIEVLATGLGGGRRTVAAEELQEVLIRLPVFAWPYGRVVAVEEISIRAADGADTQPIAANLEAALNTLRALKVTTVERWP